MSEQPKRLHRLRKGRKVLGVLGGLAEFFGLDPSLVRITYLVITFFTLGVPGIVLYLAMAFIIPLKPKAVSATD